MTEEQLCALLRSKRHAQPPPEYFTGLLREVHRRQREELLHRPLWRICLDRLQCFFGEQTLAPLSYAGALAAVVIVGVATIHTMVPKPFEIVADNGALTSSSPLASQTVSAPAHFLTLQPSPARPEQLFSQHEFEAQPGQVSHTPRYVIDARPVSYDASFSF